MDRQLLVASCPLPLPLIGAGLVAAALLLHVLLWRLRRPRRPFLGLAILFLSVLAGFYAGAALWLPGRLGFWEMGQLGVFHLSTAAAYVITYTALEGSPSVTIVAFIAAAGEAGREASELSRVVGDDTIMGRRFESLLAAGLLRADGRGAYFLTRKGRFWARVFSWSRKVFCLKTGG